MEAVNGARDQCCAVRASDPLAELLQAVGDAQTSAESVEYRRSKRVTARQQLREDIMRDMTAPKVFSQKKQEDEAKALLRRMTQYPEEECSPEYRKTTLEEHPATGEVSNASRMLDGRQSWMNVEYSSFPTSHALSSLSDASSLLTTHALPLPSPFDMSSHLSSRSSTLPLGSPGFNLGPPSLKGLSLISELSSTQSLPLSSSYPFYAQVSSRIQHPLTSSGLLPFTTGAFCMVAPTLSLSSSTSSPLPFPLLPKNNFDTPSDSHCTKIRRIVHDGAQVEKTGSQLSSSSMEITDHYSSSAPHTPRSEDDSTSSTRGDTSTDSNPVSMLDSSNSPALQPGCGIYSEYIHDLRSVCSTCSASGRLKSKKKPLVDSLLLLAFFGDGIKKTSNGLGYIIEDSNLARELMNNVSSHIRPPSRGTNNSYDNWKRAMGKTFRKSGSFFTPKDEDTARYARHVEEHVARIFERKKIPLDPVH